MRRKKLRIAIVYWLDAYGAEEHGPEDGALQLSAGVLIEKSRRCIKLAQIADTDGTTEPYRDVLTIPAGMVRSVMVLDAPTEPHPRRKKSAPAEKIAPLPLRDGTETIP